MDAIMIDSSDEAAETCDKDKSKPKNRHKKRVPIVYTTKLEDMNIFKEDISDMDVDTIISTIIKESKPKFNWKRKYSETTHSRCSNEDLSSHISNFNRKVARTVEDNLNLNNKSHYPVCKPVKVVLEDIKYSLLRGQTTDSNLKPVKITSPYVNTKAAISISRKLKIYLIYDQQNKEADVYSLDKSLLVEHNMYRIDESNDHIFRELKLSKNVSEVSCCCWYEREQYLANNMLGFIPHGTLRFMRKPHKCAVNRCRCCCSNQSIHLSNYTSALRPRLPSESPSIWFNKMMESNALPSSKSGGSLRSKPLRVVPKLSKKIYPVKPAPEHKMPYFLYSTGIDFGEEYYAIGADGNIKLYLKDTGKDPQKLANLKSKTSNNIVGNICCWFRRQEFADRLLLHGASRNTVNYIRTAHTCPTANCICCCKPSNTKKFQLPRIHKLTRHTNDLVSKKINIKVRFKGVVEEPVVEPVSVKEVRKNTTKNKNKIISFNVSLSALEKISKCKGSEDFMCKEVFDSLIPETAILDQNKRSVRVIIEKTAKKENVVIECKTNLDDFTTYELTLLDIIFRAVNNNTQQTVAPAHQKNNLLLRKSRTKNVYGHTGCSPIYPLLLNTQLSITSDLRNKRFMPPLKAHLEKYNLLEKVSNISLWMAEAKQKELGPRLVAILPKVKKTKE